MPIRRWVTEHSAYGMLALALGMIVCMYIAVTVSIQASERSRQMQRAEDCVDILTINDAYRRQVDELSEPGKDIARAWERIASRC